MTYAVQQDLIDRFGNQEILELTDRASLGAIDAAVVDRALADADGEINSYLESRYTLPLAAVTPILVRLAADIARYYLYDDRVTDSVKKRYDDAIAFLVLVAKGSATIGVDAANKESPVIGEIQVRANDRVFSVGNQSGTRVGTLDDY